MVDAPTPPTAPDPAATAAAQTASNKDTAIANAELNRVNQYTPGGSLTYQVVGTNPDGTPQYQSNQTYSAANQALYDSTNATKQNLANIGTQQSAKIGDMLNTPFDLSQASGANIDALQRQRLDPMWAQKQDQLNTQLSNKGIKLGSDAWNNAQNQFGQNQNDAYNSMFINDQGQAQQAAMAQRNQPINEISALMSGSQVAQPQFTNVPSATQANTDVAGITQQGFANQMGLYNQQNSTNNAAMGGMFGLGGSLLGNIPWSDRRLKRDIEALGKGKRGLPLYRFNYIWGSEPQIGYMAQDVAQVAPWAVHTNPDGFMAVDYGAI